MVRRYEEPIEVQATGQDTRAGSPHAFLWRGRLYVVRSVLAHWQERRPWWRDALEPSHEGSDVLADARERHVWRVEASAGRMAGTGVYDLGADHSPRRWHLLRVAD